MTHATLPGPVEPFAPGADAATLRYLTDGCRRYGDLWAIPPDGQLAAAGDQPLVVLNDIDAIHEVLVKRQTEFEKGLGFERVRMLLGDGLIVADGDHWRRRRQMLQPAFGREALRGFGPAIAKAIARRAPVWEAHADSGQPLDVSSEAEHLALRIILRAIFGPDLEALDATDGGNPFDLIVEVRERDLRFAHRFRQLWPVVRDVVERRRRAGLDGPPTDFLGHYLAARDRESGAGLDDEGVVDEVMTLVIAGHEAPRASALSRACCSGCRARSDQAQAMVAALVS
ncbi:MAG: cytochrome P450, partial [Planctomycetota bacterium]